MLAMDSRHEGDNLGAGLGHGDRCPHCGRPPVDIVTGLADRWTWEERAPISLRRALLRGCPVAVLVADVDGFKRINTDHGHPAGDVILRAIADVARCAVRPDDLVCRAGGNSDEILILLTSADATLATSVAGQMRAAVAELAVTVPTHTGARTVDQLSISVGYCVYDPLIAQVADEADDAPDLDQLVLAADAALLSVQAAGGGVWPVYWSAR
jgi:diguanylate cyclase (GGDEF)-like protein